MVKIGSILRFLGGFFWLWLEWKTNVCTCFSFFVMYFHDISILRKRIYVPMLTCDYNLCQSCSSSQKLIFVENTLELQLVVTWERAMKIWKKFKEFVLTIRETKFVKMKLLKPLFQICQICLILTKNGS